MFSEVLFILIVMVIAYTVAKLLRLSVEISMLVTAVVGALAGRMGFSTLRHIAEGATTYIDLCLIFVTATLFMNIVKESGGVDYIVNIVVNKFRNKRPIALILLMVIMFIPGALCGAGSVSVLVVGGTVALALAHMGISKTRIAAIIFLLAGLSAVAPPVNVWAMLTCAGTAIPYVGFELPLGIPVLLLGLFTVFVLGMKRAEKEEAGGKIADLPATPEGVTGFRVILPFLVVFGLIIASRVWPYTMPILGLPLIFSIAALVALLASTKKIDFIALSMRTVKQILPLLATMVVVGIILQVMSATGVRGLLSLTVITMPVVVIYLLLPVTIPVSEGLFTYGGAVVLGIPLIWMFNSIGIHPTIALSGLSLLWCLGDALPPTAIIARLTHQTVEYKGSYLKFLKTCWVPWLAITLVGTLMVVFSRSLTFLVH